MKANETYAVISNGERTVISKVNVASSDFIFTNHGTFSRLTRLWTSGDSVRMLFLGNHKDAREYLKSCSKP